MKQGPASRLASSMPFLAGTLAVASGGLVLLGWTLDIAVLKSVLPDWVAMKPNTAVAFVLIGVALLLFHPPSAVGPQPSAYSLQPATLVSRLAGLLAGLIGLLSLAEYAFDWNPGFDQWLFPEPSGAVGTSHPGRMAPDAAICFTLLAVGLEFARLARRAGSASAAPILVGSLVVTIGLVEILSYFTPALRTYGWGGLTMMALPTAVLFTALGAAVVGSVGPLTPGALTGSAQPFAPSDDPTSLRFILIFAGLAVVITAAGTFYYRSLERQFRADAEQQLAAIAELKVSELTQYRKGRLDDASLLQNNPSFTQLVRRFLASPGDEDAPQQLQAWLRNYQSHSDYDRVRLLDAQGVTRLSMPAGLGPVSSSIALGAAEVQRSGQVRLQDFYRSESDQHIYLAVLVPVFDEADRSRPLGVVVLRIDPNLYLYPFINRWPGTSATAETLLVRREGDEAVFLNELRFQKNTALTMRSPLATDTVLPAARAAMGQEGVVEGRDYREAPVLAALRTIPDSPWFLVARRDQAEVFAPLRSQLWQVIVIIGVLLFGTGAGVGLVGRRQRVGYYRKQAAAATALTNEKQNLEALFASSPVAMFILDDTTSIVRVNAAAVALSEASSAEVLEQRPGNALKCVHSMEDPRGCGYALACRVCATRHGIEKVLAAGGSLHGIELPFDLVRKGTVQRVWIRIGAERIMMNGRRHLIVAMDDITELKTSEQRLLRLQKLLTETEKMGKVGGWEIDIPTGHQIWTEEVYRIHEVDRSYDPAVADGIQFYTAESRTVIEKAVQRAIAEGMPFDEELEIITAKGHRRQIHAIGRADRLQHKVFGFFQDITARKLAENAVRELNTTLEHRVAERTAELAAANKELEAFSYSVSHDLRTPLRSIDGFSRVVLEDYAAKLDDDGRDSLNRIRTAAQRMGHLIEDMLTLSRTSRAELHRERVDLSALARDVADGLRRQNPARPVELTVADGLAAECDLRLMRTVLENLLGNAWKFTGQCAAPRIEFGVTTTPALSALNPQPSTLNSQLPPLNSQPIYFIRDNGAGFDEAYAGKLFGAFQRLHAAEEFAGTGIGLANVQRIIHRHGGHVWAHAKVGEGATFYFTLGGHAGVKTP